MISNDNPEQKEHNTTNSTTSIKCLSSRIMVVLIVVLITLHSVLFFIWLKQANLISETNSDIVSIILLALLMGVLISTFFIDKKTLNEEDKKQDNTKQGLSFSPMWACRNYYHNKH